MGKLSYIKNVIKGASLEKFNYVVGEAARRSGKSKLYCFFDIIHCMIRHKAGYYDYIIFEFWNRTEAQRKTYLTRFRNKKFILHMNDPEYSHIFDNKNEFNIRFADYIRRDYVDLATASEDEIRAFFDRNEHFFMKPASLASGEGCEGHEKSEYASFEEFLAYIRAKDFDLVEERLRNHPDIAKVYDGCLNCMRAITVVDSWGKAHCIYCVAKFGRNGRQVDSYGVHGPIDLETGRFLYPAHSGDTTTDEVWTEHPNSHIPLVGFQIPMHKEAIELVERAALEVPQIRYIGWDVAVTDKGPVIIEGNNYSAHDFWQLPCQTPDGIGIIPTLEKLVPEMKF